LEDSVKLEIYADIFDCQMGFWPIKYLGAPVSGTRIRVKDLNFIDERQSKNLDGWPGGSLSLAGRKVLIVSSLNRGQSYLMSLFRFCKTVNFKLMKRQRCFFWQGGSSF
jgi:hypothetical protein